MNSLTFNGVKVTLIFHDNNWELALQTGNNRASICGSISEPCNPIESLETSNEESQFLEIEQDDLIHTVLKKIATDLGFKDAIENPEEHLKNVNAYCWNNKLSFDTVEQIEQGILHYFTINSIKYNTKLMDEFKKWKNTNQSSNMEAFSFQRVKSV